MVKRSWVRAVSVVAMLRSVAGQSVWFLSSGVREVCGVYSSCRVTACGLELFLRDGYRTVTVVWRMSDKVASTVVGTMGALA